MEVKREDLEYFNDLEQGTEEWMMIRRGLCTASEAAKGLLAAKTGFNTYMIQKEAELYLQVIDPGYTSTDMQRGTDLEPIARQNFAEKYLVEVEEVGFIRNLKLNAGCSPDGIVKMHEIGLEIKCFNSTNHFRTFKEGMEKVAHSQATFSLAITGYKAWYVVYFNPDFDEEHQMNVFKLERNEEVITSMQLTLLHVKKTIDV